jgi:hypothetical protein
MRHLSGSASVAYRFGCAIEEARTFAKKASGATPSEYSCQGIDHKVVGMALE